MVIKNKIAIVTGASMGIGKETARLLTKKGADLEWRGREVSAVGLEELKISWHQHQLHKTSLQKLEKRLDYPGAFLCDTYH